MINPKKYKSIKGKNAQKQGLELNMHPFSKEHAPVFQTITAKFVMLNP